MPRLSFGVSFMISHGPKFARARTERSGRRDPGYARSARPRNSFHPVLYFQSGHALELALVVGHQREPGRFRMGSNPEIVVSDGLALRFERRSDRAISMTGLRGKRHDRQKPRQLLQLSHGLGADMTFLGLVPQLALSHDGTQGLDRFPPRELAPA